MSNVLGPLAAFVAVLALIPLALWLLKRTPLGGAAASGALRVVALLPLAPNQRIVTVEVGQGEDRRWLVLGVTPNGINTLHTLPAQSDAPMAPGRVTTAALPFAGWLARSRAGRTDPAPGSGDDAR